MTKRTELILGTLAIAAACFIGCKTIHVPDVPPIPLPTIPTVTTTTVPPVEGEWGAAIPSPDEDLAKEWNYGNPRIRVISLRPDKFLGQWAAKGLSQTREPDGRITSRMVPIQGPSGEWYKPYSWRLKTDSAADYKADFVTATAGEYGEVTRARYECRKRTVQP